MNATELKAMNERMAVVSHRLSNIERCFVTTVRHVPFVSDAIENVVVDGHGVRFCQ
jgi:hypothetical protein